MPLFAVHALDRPDALPLRLQHYAAHRAYVETDHLSNVSVIMSGPLQTADGEMMTGSLLIVEAADQGLVESFTDGDPFKVELVWGQICVSRFLRRIG